MTNFVIGTFSYDCAKWLSDSLSDLSLDENTLMFLSLFQY